MDVKTTSCAYWEKSPDLYIQIQINLFVFIGFMLVIANPAQQTQSCCQKGADHAKLGGVCTNPSTLTNSEKIQVACIVTFKECCQYSQNAQCQMGMEFAR